MLLCMLDVALNHQLLAQCCAACSQEAKNKTKKDRLKAKICKYQVSHAEPHALNI